MNQPGTEQLLSIIQTLVAALEDSTNRLEAMTKSGLLPIYTGQPIIQRNWRAIKKAKKVLP